MSLNSSARTSFVTGTIILALAVLIGAFGAHGIKNLVAPERLVTFETGVRYHFYHGFGLILIALTQQLLPTIRLQIASVCFVSGILFFSLNCYAYVLSDMKIFAMLVPIGGVLFMIGWLSFAWRTLKFRN
jgi:uncharacterized membrane protein YgdD (TMEM256/DUF423 family)